MWCVFDSSFEFNECVASFESEAEAQRFRLAYLERNPEFFPEWVWTRCYPDAPGPEFVAAHIWDGSWTW